jgi:exodeoxyribonuclease VII large subunit
MTFQKNNPTRKEAEHKLMYTVSGLNEKVRITIEKALGLVWIQGEISNLARPNSGHIYFSLKDNASQVRCAMFRAQVSRVKFRPENGDLVTLRAKVSLYPARGDYQLIIESMEASGSGDLQAQFNALKNKLFEAGLFSQDRKRALPKWPKQIGLITSTTGAAVKDLLTVLKRRCPSIPIVIYPTTVQGVLAAKNICLAIHVANQRTECDVLIVGRGGGSLEDLWSFNEEIVAQAIFNSTIPIISAVGHEVDVTIADLVADVRAATPSAAAELASPDLQSWTEHFLNLSARLSYTVVAGMERKESNLLQLRKRLTSPKRKLEIDSQRIDDLSQRLLLAWKTFAKISKVELNSLRSTLAAKSPGKAVDSQKKQLLTIQKNLRRTFENQILGKKNMLKQWNSVLHAMGPAATLERGYSILTDTKGVLIRNSEQVVPGQEIVTRLVDGRINSLVKEQFSEKTSDKV